MTDKELLELAAKAHGGLESISNFGWMRAGSDVRSAKLWRPLTDDGDALRLLTKIGMQMRFVQIDPVEVGNGRTVIELQWVPGGIKNRISKVVEAGEDPDALLRRAIVRAAAEIGKGMP